MTVYKIAVYAPGSAPRAVHMGASEADMLSHLNAVEGAFQATRATAHIEVIAGRRSRRISYQDGMRIESALPAPGARVKVQIRVVYWGRNRFVVRVLKDGVTLEQQPASRATVEARRNLVCDRWSKLGYEVEAEAIPDAWDLCG